MGKTSAAKKASKMMLEHWTDVPGLKSINPAHMGTGVDAFAGRAKPSVPFSYYYKEGQAPEALLANKAHKYKVEVDPAQVYDFEKDPKGIIKAVKDENGGAFNFDTALEKLKAEGFQGFSVGEGANNPNTVHMFNELPVVKSAKDKMSEPHVIFSAVNPRVNPSVAMTHDQVLKNLEDKGLDVTVAKGKYGSEEPSIIVHNPSKADTREIEKLASDLGQESVLVSNGKEHELRYLNGPDSGTVVKGKGTEWHKEAPADMYTQLPEGETFSHNLNFDSKALKGASAVGAPLINSQNDPTSMVKGAYNAYNTAKQSITDAIANRLDVKANPQQPSAKGEMKSIIGTVADPANLLPGAGQIGAQALEHMAAPVAEEFADGGSVGSYEGMDFDSLPSAPAAALPKGSSAMGTAQPHAEGMDFDSLKSDEDIYTTPGQKTTAAIEGAARGILGPLAPLLETKVLGVPEQDIKARKEQNPYTAGGTEAAGFVGSMFTPVGWGKAVTGVGHVAEAGAKAAGMAAEGSYFARVGSSAVKNAAEFMAMQAGDEATKQILHEPEASAENAIADVGLAGLIGAGTGVFFAGAVSPLWKATTGSKAGLAMTSILDRVGGVEAPTDIAAQLQAKTGIRFPSELKAKINGDEIASGIDSILSQRDTTKAAKAYQASRETLVNDLKEAALGTFGRSAKEAEALGELNKYESGVKAGDTLHKDLEKQIAPLTKAYDAITEQFKAVPIPKSIYYTATEQIANKAIEQGWHKAESSAQMDLVQSVFKKLNKQENASDLKKFITNLYESNPFGKETYQAARDIAGVLRDTQEKAIEAAITKTGGSAEQVAQKLSEYNALRGQYKNLMNNLDTLDSHLHLGRWEGPQTFLNALKTKSSEMGEQMINRLSGGSRAQILDILKQVSPSTLDHVKQYHVDNLIRSAGGKEVTPTKLLSKFNNLSPQVKELLADTGRQERLGAIEETLKRLEDPTHNWSNTARTLDKLGSDHMSPIAMAMAMMSGHGAVTGLMEMLGIGMAKRAVTGGLDAGMLGMLKLLAADKPVNAAGLKASVEFMDAAIKGNTKMNKAIDGIFKRGSAEGINGASSAINPPKSLIKLDKVVKNYQDKPEDVVKQQASNELGHYNPEHQMALSGSTTNALNYLSSLSPKPHKNGPLDVETPPSDADVQRYQRALHIAQEPSVVLEHIKNGTLLPSDVTDLQTMYPSLAKDMALKLSNKMMQAEEPIPYQSRLSMSLFLGQPLDSTMNPSSIVAAQPKPKANPQQAQAAGKAKKGTQTLGKSNKDFMTADQAAESNRLSKR